MGRKPYKTIEEVKETKRLRARRYYEKHKDEINRKNLERYFKGKDRGDGGK
jgi:hypothetical protein